LKEARYYEKLAGRKVHCHLCPQECVINEGRKGFCGVRENHEGALYSDIYERILAANLDPIEKKPLYHFHPGRTIFSIGTRGCNQRCDFCQNWQMIETETPGTYMNSDEVADMADRGGSIGVAYTYNEPMMWYEFVLECARKVRDRGLVNVLVTNGSVNPEPLEELLPLIDAMNIDVKSMDPAFYRKICKSKLEPVLETARRAKRDNEPGQPHPQRLRRADGRAHRLCGGAGTRHAAAPVGVLPVLQDDDRADTGLHIEQGI
jgi:pyruvate formate lyase activating enzyme